MFLTIRKAESMRILLFLSLSFVAVSAMAVPRFIGAERYGVRPGHELIWRVPVVGAARVEAVSLPDGVTFDVPRHTLRGCDPLFCSADGVEQLVFVLRGRQSGWDGENGTVVGGDGVGGRGLGLCESG